MTEHGATGMLQAHDFPPIDLAALARSGEQLTKAADLLDAAHESRVKALRGAAWSNAVARPIWDERLDARIRVGQQARAATRRVGEASLDAAGRLGHLRDLLRDQLVGHIPQDGVGGTRIDQIVRDARNVVEHLVEAYRDEESHIAVVRAIEAPEPQFGEPTTGSARTAAQVLDRPATRPVA